MAQAVRTPTQSVAPTGSVWLTVVRTAWIVLTALILIATVLEARVTFQQSHITCVLPHCTGAELPRIQADALRSIGVSIDAYALYSAVQVVVFTCIYVVVAAAIIWRKSEDRMGLLTAFTLVLFGGITFSQATPLNAALPVALHLPVQILGLLGDIGLALFFYLFPDGRLALRWPLLLAVPWAVLQAGYYLAPGSAIDENKTPPLLTTLAWIAVIASFIYVQIYRYHKFSDATERQQTKWVVYGSTAAGVFVIAISLGTLFQQVADNPVFLTLIGTLFSVFTVLIPLSIGFAILRYRLWDVDLLINRTLVYGLLTALLATLYIGSVILLQALFRALTGQGSNLSIAISTLAIAALFQPLRRSIQSLIDRRFYRRKYDAARMLTTFQAKLRDEVDLDQLTTDLLGVIQDTVQPAHVSIWLREAGTSEVRSASG